MLINRFRLRPVKRGSLFDFGSASPFEQTMMVFIASVVTLFSMVGIGYIGVQVTEATNLFLGCLSIIPTAAVVATVGGVICYVMNPPKTT